MYSPHLTLTGGVCGDIVSQPRRLTLKGMFATTAQRGATFYARLGAAGSAQWTTTVCKWAKGVTCRDYALDPVEIVRCFRLCRLLDFYEKHAM
jgi:hypothetical protein